MPDPWQVLDSRLILDRSPWLVLREEHVRLPNGVEIPNFLLAREPSVAMTFAVTSDGLVPLVAQYRHGIRQVALDLPAGFIDANEEPLDAARRELVEETGYVADSWTRLGTLYRNHGRGDQQIHMYLARGATPDGARHLDHTEDLEVRLVPLATVMSLVTDGAISSLSSAAAVLWALQRLDHNDGRGGA